MLLTWTLLLILSTCAAADRPIRTAATTAPILQGLSLLDLPVFSRGDRPNSMDKTLGAIFSKVAFSAASNQTANPKEIIVNIVNSDINNSTVQNGTNSSTTAGTTSTTSTSTAAPLSDNSTNNRPIKPPVFEFDTRNFDFIPYDRTPPPAVVDPGRQYNPNVPGLRGPSRINTARHPSLPTFNLRPTIPPLVLDLTSTTSSTTTSTTSTTSTTTTSTTSTTTTTPSTTTTEELTTSSTTTSTIPPLEEDVEPESSTGREESAWSVQIYGVCTLFAVLGLYTLSNLLRLRTSAARRLLSTSHCLSIQLLVLFLSITRSIHLLYDAYNQKRLLPAALAFSIFNVAFPCLSSALAVLLLGIFKATKLQVMPGILVKPALWAALVAFHFALSLSIDIVVGSVGGLFSLHLASQAYFVLWSLALSLGYLAAFGPATRAALSLQTETMRGHLTALHLHGASLPRLIPQPTLLRAVRVTLAAAILALLVAAFQLYGMFGVYGLPWRQQQSLSASSTPSPVVLTQEFLARYQGLQKDRNLNVDALREVLGLPSVGQQVVEMNRDPWPVAPENFWPWWTYQLIARLLEFVMAALIAYVAAQPYRSSNMNGSTMDKQSDGTQSSSSSAATKKSSIWLFTGRSLKSGSIETLSTLCCQSSRNNAANRSGASEMVVHQAGTDGLSPVKSMSSEESNYPPRNYCYSNPHHHHHHHVIERPSIPIPMDHHHHHSAGTLPANSIVYGSKRSSQFRSSIRCAGSSSTIAGPVVASAAAAAAPSSVLVNDNGFIRFRDGMEHQQQEQTYEEVDRHNQRHPHHQHIYQELGQHKAPSLTYYSTSSSMTGSSSNTTNKGTATTPSTCTYEHLCRRGLAGYYEPQRYEMQPQQPTNHQLLSLLAKESSCQMFQHSSCNIYGGSLSGQHPPPPSQHALLRQCQHHCHCGSESVKSTAPNYESYGPKPEAQSPVASVEPDLRNIPIFL